MIFASKLTRNVFITFGIILLFLNLYYWVYQTQQGTGSIWVNGHYEFHGFNWFFGKLSAFPGIQRTVDAFTHIKSYLSNVEVDDPALQGILYWLKLIGLPFRMVLIVIINLFENVAWFFSFFFDFIP